MIVHKTLDTRSGRISNTSRYTSAQTLDADDHIVFCSGTFDVDLPVGVEGTHYKIINSGSGTITVDADTTGSSTVLGATTAVLSAGEIIDIHYNATDGWW